jgi:hypothetical protein
LTIVRRPGMPIRIRVLRPDPLAGSSAVMRQSSLQHSRIDSVLS